ncbi:hypothetical protein N8633_02910, partial [bacterium]|nr:hypothetical protein [bacterium]
LLAIELKGIENAITRNETKDLSKCFLNIAPIGEQTLEELDRECEKRLGDQAPQTVVKQELRAQGSLLNILVFSLLLLLASRGIAADSPIGERPTIANHLNQRDLEDTFSEAGKKTRDRSIKDLLRFGEKLFSARFNILDGQGRPASTGTGAPRIPDQPSFIRTSAPESNSCAGCHNQPFVGGAGDIVANVFVLAQALDPVTFSVSPEFSNERNTLGMFGAGPIEMLAREISFDLTAIRGCFRNQL